MTRRRATFERLRDETGDTRALAVARIGLGLLLFNEAREAWRWMSYAFFGDQFFLSSLPPSLWPSRPVYAALLALLALLSLLVIAGRGARPALLASSLLILYTILVNRLFYHHYRYSLLVFSAILAFAPCDRQWVWKVPRLRQVRSPIGPLWAQRLAQAQVSLMYLASGSTKLFNPDWFAGRVMADGVSRFADLAIAEGAPAWLVHALCRPDLAAVLARLAIATELFLSFGLWSRRLRPFALWLGVWFHLLILITTRVDVFTYLMLFLYALFATPDTRARTVRFPPAQSFHRRAVWLLRQFDWLARFAVEERAGSRFQVVDRDGRVWVGWGAVAAIARALPILFPLWLPLALAARLGRRQLALASDE